MNLPEKLIAQDEPGVEKINIEGNIFTASLKIAISIGDGPFRHLENDSNLLFCNKKVFLGH